MQGSSDWRGPPSAGYARPRALPGTEMGRDERTKKPRSRRRSAGLHHRCACCGREIPDDREVFGFGAKARSGASLEDRRGQVVEIAIQSLGKIVPAVVTGVGSPAARVGHDLYFMTCSESCAGNLRAALKGDIDGEVSIE